MWSLSLLPVVALVIVLGNRLDRCAVDSVCYSIGCYVSILLMKIPYWSSAWSGVIQPYFLRPLSLGILMIHALLEGMISEKYRDRISTVPPEIPEQRVDVTEIDPHKNDTKLLTETIFTPQQPEDQIEQVIEEPETDSDDDRLNAILSEPTEVKSQPPVPIIEESDDSVESADNNLSEKENTEPDSDKKERDSRFADVFLQTSSSESDVDTESDNEVADVDADNNSDGSGSTDGSKVDGVSLRTAGDVVYVDID